MTEPLGGTVTVASKARFEKNPAVTDPGSDEPLFIGLSALVRLEIDGTVTIRVAGHATYGNPPRTIAVAEDVDLAATDIDEKLKEILELHAPTLRRRAVRAAGRAWDIAIRSKEMAE